MREDVRADPRFIVVAGKVCRLAMSGYDGLWRDEEGTIYAFPDENQADKIVRCGVGVFSLPANDRATDACAFHDYAYSSPAYQAFHTREEADLHLARLLRLVPRRRF